MRKTLLLAGVLYAFIAAPASAENWVHAGTYSLYDADSAYVESQTGLVYATICITTSCTIGDASNDTVQTRFDCDAGTAASYVEGQWQPPSSEGDGPNDYSSRSTTADIIKQLCVQKDILPTR